MLAEDTLNLRSGVTKVRNSCNCSETAATNDSACDYGDDAGVSRDRGNDDSGCDDDSEESS